jgi:hypothetical protein
MHMPLPSHKNDTIMLRTNTTLSLKVESSYMFRLAKVSIIRLNMTEIKSQIWSCNWLFDISNIKSLYNFRRNIKLHIMCIMQTIVAVLNSA